MRITLCIGCNSYEHLPPLEGAEQDARRVFSTLTDPKYGNYDPQKSKLLLSPTMADVRNALGEILYSGYRIDDFSLFFAGHGGIEYDTLYLAFNDTNSKSLALSGFSFSELARIIVSRRPVQANFILDACQSGGLGLDLPAILKQSLTGTPESTGVAALAAAASNESALELPEGGAFTTEFLRILKGEIVVQRHKPFLDLPEIGSMIVLDDSDNDKQTVSRWALNLQGPNRFSLNPHFTPDVGQADIMVLSLGRRLNLSDKDIASIRRINLEIRDEIRELDLASLLERLSSDLSPDDSAILLTGLAETLTMEAREASDPFAESRILGVFAGQLLRHSDKSTLAQAYLQDIILRTRAADRKALQAVARELRDYEYRLISRHDALADLFFLPIRISDILGRIGWLLLNNDISDEELEFLQSLTSTLLETYGNSILSVSEEQSVPIATFLIGCAKHQWIEFAEEVICRLYSDLVENFARVASYFIDGDKALIILEQRYIQVIEPDRDLYQSPSDLATVIVFFAALYNLDEAIDRLMVLIDHTSLNIFIPDYINQLGAKGPVGGQNVGYTIGHGVWRCIDVRREWVSTIAPLFQDHVSDLNDIDIQGGIAACLSLRDRIPWAIALLTDFASLKDEFCNVSFIGSSPHAE